MNCETNISQWPESSAACYYVPVNGGGCRTEYIVLVEGGDVNMFNGSKCASDKVYIELQKGKLSVLLELSKIIDCWGCGRWGNTYMHIVLAIYIKLWDINSGTSKVKRVIYSLISLSTQSSDFTHITPCWISSFLHVSTSLGKYSLINHTVSTARTTTHNVISVYIDRNPFHS